MCPSADEAQPEETPTIKTPRTTNRTCRMLHQINSDTPAARGFRPINESWARYGPATEPETQVISQTASSDGIESARRLSLAAISTLEQPLRSIAGSRRPTRRSQLPRGGPRRRPIRRPGGAARLPAFCPTQTLDLRSQHNPVGECGSPARVSIRTHRSADQVVVGDRPEMLITPSACRVQRCRWVAVSRLVPCPNS